MLLIFPNPKKRLALNISFWVLLFYIEGGMDQDILQAQSSWGLRNKNVRLPRIQRTDSQRKKRDTKDRLLDKL